MSIDDNANYAARVDRQHEREYQDNPWECDGETEEREETPSYRAGYDDGYHNWPYIPIGPDYSVGYRMGKAARVRLQGGK